MLPVPLSVFLDANVLFSRTLRDWLVLIALDSIHTAYRLRWSEAVLAEAFYHLRRKYPDAPADRVEKWRDQMDEYFPAAKVTGWNPADVPCPSDVNDHHVVAAAYTAEVDILITLDGKRTDLQRCLDKVGAGITVMHADEFLCMVADRHPELVRQRFERQVTYIRRRARTPLQVEAGADQAVDALDRAGATTFSFLLRTDERFRIWSVDSSPLGPALPGEGDSTQ